MIIWNYLQSFSTHILANLHIFAFFFASVFSTKFRSLLFDDFSAILFGYVNKNEFLFDLTNFQSNEGGKWFFNWLHTVWKNEKFTLTKYISSNQLFSNLSSKLVTFTKVLPKRYGKRKNSSNFHTAVICTKISWKQRFY